MRSGDTISNSAAVFIEEELQREGRQVTVVGDDQLVWFERVRLQSQVRGSLGQYRAKKQEKTAGELCIQ